MADPLTADTGFLPRFLLCEPPSTIVTRLNAKVRHNECAIAAFGDHLRSILDRALPMDPDTRELQPRTLQLSESARAQLVKFSDYVEEQQTPGRSLSHIKGYASKAAEQAARLAGVLTAWADLDAPEVTPGTMANAIELADFYLSEASRLANAATLSAEIERAETLRKWLLTRWEHAEILPSEVVRHAPITALRESPAARAAIAILAKHGWLAPLPEGTIIRGAARKEAWRIVRSALGG